MIKQQNYIIATSLLVLLADTTSLLAQPRLRAFGLEGITVTALDIAGALTSQRFLYATTEEEGVFRRDITHADSGWVSLGLQGKNLIALDVQVWGAGPAVFETPVVAVNIFPSENDTISIYRLEQNEWLPADSGIVDFSGVLALDSFASSGHEPPGKAFAGGADNCFYISNTISRWWQDLDGCPAADGVFTETIAVRQNDLLQEVWIGGSGGLVLYPRLSKSSDLGVSWQNITFDLNLGIENVVKAIAFSAIAPNTVYVGLERYVIKTMDGGTSWQYMPLQDNSIAFEGLAIDPFDDEHVYAGGHPIFDNQWALWESFDSGASWQEVVNVSGNPLTGIVDLIADPHVPGVIYVATGGEGVWRYESSKTGVDNEEPSTVPQSLQLAQNFPNPFRNDEAQQTLTRQSANTTIRFTLSSSLVGERAHLAIYNLRGELVRELVNQSLPAGEHAVHWDGRDARGRPAAVGVYFYKLQVGRLTEVRKLTLIN